MKAVVLNELKKITCTDVSFPSLKSGEVLLKIRACGICSSDLDRVFLSGAYHYPIILGHEFSGEIVDVFDNNDKKMIGKRATVFPLLPCNNCINCKNSNYAQCVSYDYFGSRRDGGYAEYLAVPKWNVKIFDDSLPYQIGALTEPCAVAWHAFSHAGVFSNKKVLIIGTGTIGIMIGMWANKFNNSVFFLSRNKKKTEFLKGIGYKHFISSDSSDEFDMCFESVGSNDCIEKSIRFCKPMGKVILVGNPKNDIAIDRKIYWKILRQEIKIEGIWNSIYPDDWNYVLKNMGKLNLSELITHTFRMEDCVSAFNTLHNINEFKIKGMFINE